METNEEIDAAADLYRHGNIEEAKKAFLLLLEKGQDLDRVNFYLAHLAADEGNNGEAQERYQKAVELKPDYYQAWNNLGLIYLNKNEFDKAHECFLKTHELSPDEQTPVYNLGLVEYKKGNYKEALNYYEKMKLEPLPPVYMMQAMTEMGSAYLQVNEIEKAEAIYQRAANLFSRGMDWSQLAFIYLEIKHDFAKALEYADKAVKFGLKFWPGWQNKALAHKNLGQYNEAVDAMSKVIELEPNNFQGYYNLASVYAASGDSSKIEELLRKSISMDPQVKPHLKTDQDFAKYASESWFQELIK